MAAFGLYSLLFLSFSLSLFLSFFYRSLLGLDLQCIKQWRPAFSLFLFDVCTRRSFEAQDFTRQPAKSRFLSFFPMQKKEREKKEREKKEREKKEREKK